MPAIPRPLLTVRPAGAMLDASVERRRGRRAAPLTRIVDMRRLSCSLKERLIPVLANTFHREWASVDHRYHSAEAAAQVIRQRVFAAHAMDVVLVALRGDTLVATAGLARRDSPDFDLAPDDGRTPRYGDGWLVDVFTMAGEEGRGHASRLVERVREEAALRGLSALHLYAEESLLPFYARLGFSLAGRESVPSSDGMALRPQCVMSTRLLPVSRSAAAARRKGRGSTLAVRIPVVPAPSHPLQG